MPLGITASVPSSLTSVARMRVKRRQDQQQGTALNSLQQAGQQLSVPASELEQSGAKPPQMGGVYGEERTPTNDPAAEAAARERAKEAAKQKAKAKSDAVNKLGPTEQAMLDELASSKAKQLQNAASTSGLGGFGLSGASATLQADTARVADRSNALALADFKAKEGQREFADIKRKMVLNDYEESIGEDVDGDGKVGTEPEGQADREENINKYRVEKQEQQRAIDDFAASHDGDGSADMPYLGTAKDKRTLEGQGLEFTDTGETMATPGIGTGSANVYEDQFGNLWVFP
jgi:hypothetical protein